MGTAKRLFRRLWLSRFGESVFRGRIARSLPPRLLLWAALATRDAVEVELALIPHLCRPDGIAVDIGAHVGHYTHHMIRHSRQVYAFEPIPRYARFLAATFRDRVIVEAVALSDRDGARRLRIPTANLALATIEPANTLAMAPRSGTIAEIDVRCRHLDSYGLDDVAFVKIDVEGHELAVLKGARATLERNHPALLIEIEDRHRPNAIAETTAFLRELSYDGLFLRDGRLRPMIEFAPGIHQDRQNVSAWGKRGEYVANFVFVTAEARARIAPFLATKTAPT